MTATTLPTPPGGHTVYGITVYPLGEDGDEIIAFGHHDPRRFFAACQHYARTHWGWVNLADDRSETWEATQREITRAHAYFTDNPEEVAEICGDDGFTWAVEWCRQAAPSTVPATRWSA